jgi:Ni,Fe-hydrogenase maturation factor
VVSCHQLTPELADPIGAAEAVVFIDASVDEPRELRLRKLTDASQMRWAAHTSNPEELLALASQLYGKSPAAWWLTVPAFDLNFGDKLSAQGQAGMAAALEAFKELWAKLNGE